MPLGKALLKLSNIGQTRSKRSFFSMKLPFMQSDEKTERSVTTATEETEGTSGMSTTQTNVVTIKEVSSISPTETNGVTIKENEFITKTVASNDSIQTAGSSVSTKIDNNEGYISRIQTNVMKIVSIREDMENSMVVASPYLPMVYKVVLYLIPGASTYQIITLTVNIATITAQALKQYAEGESLTGVTLKAGSKIAYDTLVCIIYVVTSAHQTIIDEGRL